MICLELNWFFYDPSWMLQLSEFVWTLRSSVWVVINNFLLIDATDKSKISSDQKRLFFAVSLYPLSFFTNTPFNLIILRFTLQEVCEVLTQICEVCIFLLLLKENFNITQTFYLSRYMKLVEQKYEKRLSTIFVQRNRDISWRHIKAEFGKPI